MLENWLEPFPSPMHCHSIKINPPQAPTTNQPLSSTIFEPLLPVPIPETYQLADRTNFYALVNKSVKFNARDELKGMKNKRKIYDTAN